MINNFLLLVQAVADAKAGQSVILSPLSVAVIMALAALGAKEQTSREILDSLSLPCELQERMQGYQQLTARLAQVTAIFVVLTCPQLSMCSSFIIDVSGRPQPVPVCGQPGVRE